MTMLHGQHRGLMRAIDHIISERFAQHKKWGEQNHPDGTGSEHFAGMAEAARRACETRFADGCGTWADVLVEEIFEAFAESDPEALKTELVQVAAVAVAWVEAIERRGA